MTTATSSQAYRKRNQSGFELPDLNLGQFRLRVLKASISTNYIHTLIVAHATCRLLAQPLNHIANRLP